MNARRYEIDLEYKIEELKEQIWYEKDLEKVEELREELNRCEEELSRIERGY